jgi:hypothetical protein
MSCFNNNSNNINGSITLINVAEAIVSPAAASSTAVTTNHDHAAVATAVAATTTTTPVELSSQRAEAVVALHPQQGGHQLDQTAGNPVVLSTRVALEARLSAIIQEVLDIVNDV